MLGTADEEPSLAGGVPEQAHVVLDGEQIGATDDRPLRVDLPAVREYQTTMFRSCDVHVSHRIRSLQSN